MWAPDIEYEMLPIMKWATKLGKCQDIEWRIQHEKLPRIRNIVHQTVKFNTIPVKSYCICIEATAKHDDAKLSKSF